MVAAEADTMPPADAELAGVGRATCRADGDTCLCGGGAARPHQRASDVLGNWVVTCLTSA